VEVVIVDALLGVEGIRANEAEARSEDASSGNALALAPLALTCTETLPCVMRYQP
jgi:hypothetical protein